MSNVVDKNKLKNRLIKFGGKLECLIYEMPLSKTIKKPELNTQSDSIKENYLSQINTHVHSIHVAFRFNRMQQVFHEQFII